MNPLSRGVREREARKRHRRVIVSHYDFDESKWVSLKLGSKKLRSRIGQFMADSGSSKKQPRCTHGNCVGSNPARARGNNKRRKRTGTMKKQQLIKMYYEKNMTLQEIGDIFGVTRERVRQIMERFNLPRNSKRTRKIVRGDKDE